MYIKELEPEDFNRYSHFFETLQHLSNAPLMTKEKAINILKQINSQDGHVFIAVVNDGIVCSVSLFLERKFIREGTLCGHIEDVVTSKNHQKKGYASKVLTFALQYAKKRKCYKVVLYCDTTLESFYLKNNFASKGVHMELRFANK